ncbi:MAG: hypothetical protein U1E69_00775 [Tabrizicola sp.]|uniref:hypothetical protein n=1 Tax=Tabrizicola sp. TaxID=2005166 RepID=UPI002ABADBD9|nr:hypothetical protein [Tabrizicola sp.]MDZ4085315.1 hypothetical protein [Tabrizicola sp.]
MIGASIGSPEAFGQGVIFNLLTWTTWAVVAVVGVLSAVVGRWWLPLVAGALVATLTEVYAVSAIREALAPVGFVGPRNLTLGDLLPGFLVGVVLTFALQGLVLHIRKLANRSAKDWK